MKYLLSNVEERGSEPQYPEHGVGLKDATKMCSTVRAMIQESFIEALREEARLRVLYIDDDQILLKIYDKRFSDAGYNVTTLKGVEVDFVTQITEINPHLIISDIIRPNIDGIEVLRGIRKDSHTVDIPFVFFSNSLYLLKDADRKDLKVLACINKTKTPPSEFMLIINRIIDRLYPTKNHRSTTKITLPQGFVSGENVVITFGPNNSIYLYTPEDFDEVQAKIKENMRDNGPKYPNFHHNVTKGIVSVYVSEKGEITLPEAFYSHLGTTGDIVFESGSKWLSIARDHKNRCKCDDPNCRKCLLGNCKNTECSTHTKQP
jgi:CheY-like chemotaxis protein